VPLTEALTKQEIGNDYELNTAKVIVRRFRALDPQEMPAVLVAHHGPFTWGSSAAQAVEAAAVLEELAQMAVGTVTINPAQQGIDRVLLDKHFLRKHGIDAYYGQE